MDKFYVDDSPDNRLMKLNALVEEIAKLQMEDVSLDCAIKRVEKKV